jgi:hypothetical protein
LTTVNVKPSNGIVGQFEEVKTGFKPAVHAQDAGATIKLTLYALNLCLELLARGE